MAKKGKNKNKKYALRDVRMAMRTQNYKNAYRMLVNAKVKSGQEVEAEELRKTLILAQGFSHFQDKEYLACLDYLDKNLKGLTEDADFKSKSDKIYGLAHFYLSDFSSAKEFLRVDTSVEQELPYHFYYLLSEIYESEGKMNFADLAQVDLLPASQAAYLEAASLLQAENYDAALAVLEKIEVESYSENENKNALVSLLKQELSSNLSAKVKPLYRAMSLARLEKNEIEYLSTFSDLSKTYPLTEAPLPIDKVKTLLHKLCEEGEFLSDAELKTCLSTPEELHPAILFNQLSLLLEEDFDTHKTDIRYLIADHFEKLILVPDFIFLYVKYTDIAAKAQEIRYNQVTGVLKAYVSYHSSRFTGEQADEYGWEIVRSVSNLAQLEGSVVDKRIFESLCALSDKFPMLSWKTLCDYFITPSPKIIWSYLHVFNQPLSNTSKEIITDDFKSTLIAVVMSSADNPLAGLNFVSPFEIHTQIYTHILNILSDFLKYQKPDKSDKFILSLLDTIIEIVERSEDSGLNFTSVRPLIGETFEKFLTYYEEPVDSPYREIAADFAMGKSRVPSREKLMNSLLDDINKKLDSKDKEDYISALEKLSLMAIESVDNTHFADKTVELMVVQLSRITGYLAERKGFERADAERLTKDLAAAYMELEGEYNCEHPAEFFFDVLEEYLDYIFSEEALLVLQVWFKNCRKILFEAENYTSSVRDIITDYLEEVSYLVKNGKKVQIDREFHSEWIEFMLEAEKKTRRRKFKAALQKFKKEVL